MTTYINDAFIPDPNKPNDHSDKQWSESMLSNLLLCNDIVIQKQQINGDSKSDCTAAMLHEEWKNIYPHSTLNARNIKSRLTVYIKTMGDTAGSPAKRRKIISNSATATTETTNNKIHTTSHPDTSKDGHEVTDEFAPDTPEETIENQPALAAAEVKAELFSICDNNHWVHLFSDQDVNVECILTEQVIFFKVKYIKDQSQT